MDRSTRAAALVLVACGVLSSLSSLAAQEAAAQEAEPAPSPEPPPVLVLAPEPDPDDETIPEPPPAAVPIVPSSDTPLTREEAEAEEESALLEEEEELPPPPDPEWRLRTGAGVALPLNGANQPFLRLHQEIDWLPAGAAPFFFGIGGAEYLVPGTFGSVSARLGGTAFFCEDAVVRCQGSVSLQLGAFLGAGLVAFDASGEADARFLFGAFELSLRVGFAGSGGVNFLYGSGGIGAAF